MRLIKRLEQSHLEFSLNMSHTICTDGRTEQGVINQWDMLQHRPTRTVYKDRGKACLKNGKSQSLGLWLESECFDPRSLHAIYGRLVSGRRGDMAKAVQFVFYLSKSNVYKRGGGLQTSCLYLSRSQILFVKRIKTEETWEGGGRQGWLRTVILLWAECVLCQRERETGRETERQRQGIWPVANVLKKLSDTYHVD